uniref:lipase-like domain-containing protein n=1 Tax=Staphylococcus pseudoxylosus TaxID=2282419 RepID=UPI0039061183
MKRNEKQSTKTEVQRFSIRKYSVGTVSVLAATFFIASGHVSEASELNHAQESNNGNNNTTINADKDNTLNSNQVKQVPSEDNFKLESSNASEALSQQSSEISPASHNDLVKQKAPTIQDAPTMKENTTTEKNNSVNQNTDQMQLADVDNENKIAKEATPNKAEVEKEEAPNKAEVEKEEAAPNKAEVEKEEATPNKEEAEKEEATPNKEEVEKEATPNKAEVEKEEAPNKVEVEKEEATPNKVEVEKEEAPNKEEAEKEEATPNKAEVEKKEAQTDTENKNDENSKKIENLKTKNGFNPKTNEVKQEPKNDPTKVKDSEANKQATTRNRSKVQQAEVESLLKTAKKAEQGVHVNKYPIILVHGFLGLMDGNKPDLYPNYWGGKKYKVKEALEKAGYEVYEASISAVGSNYGRAV